ncbi:MAG: T9SS type A sorting domain-containing protein, partial [Candidatus Eisenbacteria bacterium]
SDTVRFESSGSYPLRAYYADCQPCCRGFRLGGMGPAGSGMMAFTTGFNFNNDLGPCCTFGSNGPGLSLVPSALFFRSAPTVSVPGADSKPGSGTILRCWASPNPAQGRVVLALELAREQPVWAEIFDAAGRRVASLADGAVRPAGVVSWGWSPQAGALAQRASGTYFYRVRTGDGASASGMIVTVR